MKYLRSSRFASLVALSMLVPSCSGPGGSEGGEGKQDSIGCLIDKSGRGGDLALNDPIANLVLKPAGSACPPGNFTDLMTKLREVDNQGEQGGACETEDNDAVSLALVSERTQLLDDPKQPARSVFTRECGGRDEFELFLAPLEPLQIDRVKTQGLPADVEIIALDKARGVYNFYAIRDGRWHFFGDSLDMQRRRAAVGPIQSGEHLDPELECARCHEGGGPVMKELVRPWNNWPSDGYEGDDRVEFPGEEELHMAVAEKLGETSINEMDGLDMEERVRKGNRLWNLTRVRELRASGNVAALLEPLFCTVEVNLDTSQSSREEDDTVDSGPHFHTNHEVGPDLDLFVSYELPIYDAAVTRIGQRIEGTNKTDTNTRLIFPFRAGADDEYVVRLTGRAIHFESTLSDDDEPDPVPPEVGDDQSPAVVDEDFVRDVMMIDATKPIFSDARCQLRQLVPQLEASQINPDGIRAAFIKAIEAKQNPSKHERELLANLKNRDDGTEETGAHALRMAKFGAACEARPPESFLEDLLKLAAQKRTQYRLRHPDIVESRQLLPRTNLDDKVSPDAHLDLDTCACVNCGI
jgi:hypothetical protein